MVIHHRQGEGLGFEVDMGKGETRRTRQSIPALSVEIPTWNGLSLLRDNLPSVVVALEHFRKILGESYELIIVDDGGEDATTKWVEEEFSRARLIRRSRNDPCLPTRSVVSPVMTSFKLNTLGGVQRTPLTVSLGR